MIQDKAHEALTDLRGVLGVLRDDGPASRRPRRSRRTPTCRRWSTRPAESGLHVELDDRLAPTTPVPDAVGRTVYRIVQEGMTNARKHAPGHAADDRASAARPRTASTCVLRNPLGFGPRRHRAPGLGLVGLAERAELRGGRLEHGRDGATFVLRGWIPWAA